jgi:hypothetical protein
MSQQGIVIVAVDDTPKSTKYAQGSIPMQSVDCTATAEREEWSVDATDRAATSSANEQSRGDGLVQAREHAERRAEARGEPVLAVQRTDRLVEGHVVDARTPPVRAA